MGDTKMECGGGELAAAESTSSSSLLTYEIKYQLDLDDGFRSPRLKRCDA